MMESTHDELPKPHKKKKKKTKKATTKAGNHAKTSKMQDEQEEHTKVEEQTKEEEKQQQTKKKVTETGDRTEESLDDSRTGGEETKKKIPKSMQLLESTGEQVEATKKKKKTKTKKKMKESEGQAKEVGNGIEMQLEDKEGTADKEQTTKFTTVRWLPTVQALSRKNALLIRAAKWQLLILFLLPMAAMSITYVMQRVTENMYKDWTQEEELESGEIHVLTSPTTQAVKRCEWYDVYAVEATNECATILFAPFQEKDQLTVNQIMEYIAKEGNLPFVPISDDNNHDEASWLKTDTWSGGTIIGVPSVNDIGKFLVSNPGRAQAILYFASELDTNFTDGAQPLVHFRYNSTNDYYYYYDYYSENTRQTNEQLIPMALQRATMAIYQNKQNIQIRIAKRNMFADPTKIKGTDTLSQQENEGREQQQEYQLEATTEIVSSLFGPILVFAISMGAAILANHAAGEKSNGLIGSLRVIGMADSAYWFSWWLVGTVVVIVPSCLLTMALAYALDVILLTQVNALVLLIALMTQYSLIYAVHLCVVAIATNRPFLYALYFCLMCLGVVSVAMARSFRAGPEDTVGKIFQFVVPGYGLGGVVDSMYRFNTRAGFSEAARGNFSNYDWDNFINPFGQCNETILELNNTCQNIDFYDEQSCWSKTDCREIDPDLIWDKESYCAPDSCYFTPIADISRIVIMLVQTLVWMMLAWYFLQIIPSDNGLTYPPWYLFLPKYWMGSKDRGNEANEAQQRSKQNSSIVLLGLTKTFKKNTAVNNVDMEVHNGQVFVLLGHNGAGKSTLINMLTGKLSPTSGDAYVMGLSVKDNVHGIQRLVSSVPQHDLLWGELNAKEHIRMFARIKGVAQRDLNQEVDNVLHRVHLTDSAEQPAGGYSGGMKRRLSIALAGIGGPHIIMLDEPTTGVDPLNRRRIWNLVRELKRDRIVVLTTHLMQEADCLGDQIAVLDNGRIQAQGTPLNLKTEHGSGYSLSIVCDVENVDRVKALAREKMPNVDLVNEAAGSLAFGVHANELAAIPALTRQLQSEGMIREWNISQSTIEEVFLRLASQSTSMQNRQQEMHNVFAGRASLGRDVGGTGRDAATERESNLPEFDEEAGSTEDEEDVFVSSSACWRLQLSALLRKAFILKRRHWVATFVQLVIPVALMVLTKLFLFKDMFVEPSETLVWPQAIVRNDESGYYGTTGVLGTDTTCPFEWKLWADIVKQQEKAIYQLTNAQGAAASIDFPELNFRRVDRLSFRVSGLSSQAEADVRQAVVQALQFYLTRSASEESQDAADAACQVSDCGPCSVEIFNFDVVETSTEYMDFIVSGLDVLAKPEKCTNSDRPCGLDEFRVMLMDPVVMENAGDILDAPELEIGKIRFYVQSSVSTSQVLRAPSLEVNYGVPTDWRSCESCRELNPNIWLSGPNAEILERSLSQSGLYLTTKVVSSDIIATIAQNRRTLDKSSSTFGASGSFDTSTCTAIGKTDFSNGLLSNEKGFIANLENVQPWPYNDEYNDPFMPEVMCNATMQPLSSYQSLFPDAGITLVAFDVSGDSIELDVVWELDIENYNYEYTDDDEYDLFIPSRQSVYGVYCSEDDVDGDGQCIAGSNLICVRAVPYSGCEGISGFVSDADIVDTTYRLLLGATFSNGGNPAVEMMPNREIVTYTPAVDLDELALFVFMVTIAIALQAPNTASILVFEKNQRFIFAMLLNGLKLQTYWSTQYLVHLITSGCLGLVTIVLGIVLQIKPFSSQEPNGVLLLLVLLSGIHAQFGFVVLLSSFFKKERFAAVLVGFAVLTVLGAAILTHLGSGSNLKSGWPPALSLIPMFGFFRCLLLVFWKRYYGELWAHIGVMLASSTVYLFLGIYRQTVTGVGALFQWDCGVFSHMLGSRTPPTPATSQRDGDFDDVAEADIAKEEERAMKLDPQDTAIKISHLGKTFPARPKPKHAVVDLSMAIGHGEIFGLLGPNGAGKTTVISMLVGQLTPSRGRAFVSGYDTVEERRLALSKLGIVPQFDVYYPELTVQEHLTLYAAMKGVRRSKQISWSKSIAASVGLGSDDLFHRQASALSGGMRRRLSIAVALLSKPSCLFLDEPTTGLDPEMKRSIWIIIERMRKDRCVILTTHAMDEAEALCTRIGIMAQGSLKCIGTQKELRERYGSTYELTFTVPKGTSKTDESLEKYLLRKCPSTNLVSNFGATRVFTVDKSDLDLADLFEVIIKARRKKLYTEWGINNTSLDEVFIAITAESEGVAAGEL